jgi:hypothetical protein
LVKVEIPGRLIFEVIVVEVRRSHTEVLAASRMVLLYNWEEVVESI